MIMYGISLSDVIINEDKAIAFLHELADAGFDQYLQDYKEQVENEYVNTFSEWVDDFETDLYFGLSAFLWRVIKTLENINIDVESEEGVDYLGLLLRAPWEFNQKTKAMEMNEYDQIIQKYLGKITDDIIDLDYIYHLPE